MTHQELWQRVIDLELEVLDLQLIVYADNPEKLAEINKKLEAKRDALKADKESERLESIAWPATPPKGEN